MTLPRSYNLPCINLLFTSASVCPSLSIWLLSCFFFLFLSVFLLSSSLNSFIPSFSTCLCLSLFIWFVYFSLCLSTYFSLLPQQVCVFCILTSFRVVQAPESFSKHFFGAVFNLFGSFKTFFSDFTSEIKKKRLKLNKKKVFFQFLSTLHNFIFIIFYFHHVYHIVSLRCNNKKCVL